MIHVVGEGRRSPPGALSAIIQPCIRLPHDNAQGGALGIVTSIEWRIDQAKCPHSRGHGVGTAESSQPAGRLDGLVGILLVIVPSTAWWVVHLGSIRSH